MLIISWSCSNILHAIALFDIPALFPTSPQNYPYIKTRSVRFPQTQYGHFCPSFSLPRVTFSMIFFFFLFFFPYWLLLSLAVFSILFSRYNLCSCIQFSYTEQMSLLKLKCYSHSDQLCISESFKVTENNLYHKLLPS